MRFLGRQTRALFAARISWHDLVRTSTFEHRSVLTGETASHLENERFRYEASKHESNVALVVDLLSENEIAAYGYRHYS